MDSNVTASLTKHKRTTLERIEKFISKDYFTDINLYGKLYPNRRELLSIKHWSLPGGEGAWQEWNVNSVLEQNFSPVNIGDNFGPSWTTHWFKIEFRIPIEWANKEVHLRWKSQSEAMIWDLQGHPLQGLSTGTSHQIRSTFCLSKSWNAEDSLKLQTYLIEMSCTRMFGVGKGGMINPPNPDEKFTLEAAEVCHFDTEVYSFFIDLQVLHDLAKHLPDDQRGYRAMYAANQMINNLISDDKSSAKRISQNFFAKTSGECSLTLALIGNCHIDSAWLWPYSETKRKCGRSWASTVRLMKDYPEMIFACSQAQQFEWVKEFYPSLYSEIKAKSKDGQFIPVGATWVEMDGLIPNGEAFMRQFLYGQHFYQSEFGSVSNIFWLPDTFGYSGQIPQICKHFGIPYFLTQKLSWNLVNKFPHHTFIWEGIDGSTVLAHFPPGDSYELNINVDEMLRTERNLNDKGRVSISAFLYGYGDGGGGPTQDMLERARRLKNLDGCPRAEHMTPNEMFDRMALEERNLCRWVGELYLELHNGTYTSQAKTKYLNRKCEFELRKVEFLLCVVASYKRATDTEIKSKQKSCEVAWKKVLLNQFHDVLPGSSIGMVYKDSDKLYSEALEISQTIYDFCLKKLSIENVKNNISVINVLPWSVRQLITVDKSLDIDKKLTIQESKVEVDKIYIAVEVNPLSYMCLKRNDEATSEMSPIPFADVRVLHPPSVLLEESSNGFGLENQHLRVRLSKFGELIELMDKKEGSRNIFERSCTSFGKGNILTLYDDVPLYWDAWDIMDYHLETRSIINTKENKGTNCTLTPIEVGPLKIALRYELSIGVASSMTQTISLTAVDPYLTFDNEVEWKESHKLLKVEFETGIHSRDATYDIQFGHIQRPTHKNTSWDSAKFEVCGHKWANISEFDCGLSVLNDGKYGWSCNGGTLALSLLRAPKAPDDQCDMGTHSFKYAVLPHRGNLQESGTMEAAYEFNNKQIVTKETPILDGISNWLQILGKGVMVEAVKVSEGSPNTIVVRFFEMFGGARTVWLKVGFSIQEAHLSNGMEEYCSVLPISHNIPEKQEEGSQNHNYIQLHFTSFQIQTVLLTLKE